jgi:ABC-type oligopeptide transport system substrate-binding subunit
MKKVLAFLLALTMCVSVLFATGCSKIEKDDPAQKGAELEVYMGKKVMNLDPAVAYTDENAVKILNLIFEPLTRLDENGKLKKALAKDWEIIEDPVTGEEKLEITINDTHWSDGSVVQANDVIYAWRRILDPDFDSTAASMLYCIKGAKAAKAGEISIYDIGLYATTTTKFIVEFEDGADIDEFLYNTSSPALVPLRENKVVSYPDTWSRSATDLSCNGPFRVKKFSDDPTEIVILERSKYYYLNQEVSTEAIDKFVTPYRITIRYDLPIDKTLVSTTDETDVYDLFGNQIFYISGLTYATAEMYSDVQIEEEASTFCFYFNIDSDAFEEQVVRKAFSMALDRDYIAYMVGLETEPATGLLNDKVYDTERKTSFRDASGDILDIYGNIEAAKQLLADNGIDPYDYDDIYIVVRKDEKNDSYQSSQLGYMSNEYAIANYAKNVWTELGFSVVVNILDNAAFEEAYAKGDYEIIGMDFQAISVYPIYNLAAFSSTYSGGAVPVKGYENDDFNALIESAFAETDDDARAEILYEAEALLIDDAAVVPVIFNTNAYVVSDNLKNVEADYWGAQVFTKAELKDYVQYLESVKAAAARENEE